MSTITPPTGSSAAAARILDRGYRRYEGERGGVGQSMRSVVRYTIQRVLGIHRKFRFKVMPILTIVISYVPHMVFVGVVVLTNQLENRQAEIGGAGVPQGAGRAVAHPLHFFELPVGWIDLWCTIPCMYGTVHHACI